MGLKENVTETQVGGVDNTTQIPDVNLSGVKAPAVKAANTANPTAPVKNFPQIDNPPPQNVVNDEPQEASPDKWQGIYDYVKGSDVLHTKLSFEDFVSKYHNDDAGKEKLYSKISMDASKSGNDSPFSSKSYNEFMESEFGSLGQSGADLSQTFNQEKVDAANSTDTPLIDADPKGIDDPTKLVGSVAREASSLEDIHLGGSVDKQEVTNLTARDEYEFADLTDKPNPNRVDAPSINNQEKIFTNLFLEDEQISATNPIAPLDLTTDVNTGQRVQYKEDLQTDEEIDRKNLRLRYTDEQAKKTIDNFLEQASEALANDKISYEDIAERGYFNAIAGDEKLQAAMALDPKLSQYYSNSIQDMMSTAKHVIKTRKTIDSRNTILTDFNENIMTNEDFSKMKSDRFGSTPIEEVFLLNPAYRAEFINSYGAKEGYDPKEVQEAIDYQLKNYIHGNANIDKENWRKKVKSQIDDTNLTPAEAKNEFYLKYTEMQDMKGMSYYNEEQKEAAILNVQINKMSRERSIKFDTGEWSLEEERDFQALLKDKEALRPDGALYNHETGEIIEKGEENKADVQWGEAVAKIESLYRETDLDKLYKRREDIFFQLEWMQKKISSNHTYSHQKSNLSWELSPDEFVQINYADGKTEQRRIDKMLKEGEEADQLGNKTKQLEKAMPYTYGMIKDLRQELGALNNLILWNQDPSETIRTSMAGEAWNSMNEYLGGEDETLAENQVRYQSAALENAGFKLTSAQQDRLKDTVWQNLGSAIGGSIPSMAEIMLWTVVAKKVGAFAELATTSEKFIEALSGGNKAVKWALNGANNYMKTKGIDKAVSTGLVFELAGQGFSSGVGESAGQGIANKLMTGKIGKNAVTQLMIRILGGGTGETIEEYSGEFMQHMSDTGFDFGESMSLTAGEDPMTKLLETFAVSMIMSSPNSVFKTADSVRMRKYIENNRDLFSDQSLVDDVLEMNNEDGRFEARAKAMMSAGINQESISSYEKLSNSDPENLTIDDKVDMMRFETAVVSSQDLLSDKTINQIQKINPDLLEVGAEEAILDPTISKEDGSPFNFTKEEGLGSLVEKATEEAADTGDVDDGKSLVEKVTEEAADTGDVDGKKANVVVSDSGKKEEEGGSAEPTKEKGVSMIDALRAEKAKRDAEKNKEGKVETTPEPKEIESTSEEDSAAMLSVMDKLNFQPEAEPMMLDKGDTIEHTYFFSDGTEKTIIYKKKKDGSLSKRGAKLIDTTKEIEVDETSKVGEQGGTEQAVDSDGKKKSSLKEIRKGTDKGDTAKPTGRKQKLPRGTMPKAREVQSNPEQLNTLKDELGLKDDPTTNVDNLKRKFYKQGGTAEQFANAVDRARGDISKAKDTGKETDVYKKRTALNESIKKAESLVKEGKTEEAMTEFDNSRKIAEGDKEMIGIVDKTMADLAREAQNKETIAEAKKEAKKKAEESAAAEVETEKNKVISSLIGSEANLISAPKRGKATSVSGKILEATPTGTENEFEVLVEKSSGAAVKAVYNSETGEYTYKKQNKAMEKANMDKYKADQVTRMTPAQKKRNDSVSSMAEEILPLVEEAGLIYKSGAKEGKIHDKVMSLLNRIAVMKQDRMTDSRLDRFNSELNGLLKTDKNSTEKNYIEKQKLKNKIKNLLNSEVEPTVKTKKKAETVKKGRKVKKTGNASVDNANQVLSDAKPNLEVFKNPAAIGKAIKINGKHFVIHVREMVANGEITEQQGLKLEEKQKKLYSDWEAMNEAKLAAEKEAVAQLEKEIGGDVNHKSATRAVGSNDYESTGRIGARYTSKSAKRTFKLRMVSRINKNHKGVPHTIDDMMKSLVKTVGVKLGIQKAKDGTTPAWIGKFDKTTNMITLRKKRDIDTFIHEVGHKMAHKYDMDETVRNGNYDSELEKLWDEGSEPTSKEKTNEAKLNYKRREGLAEFFRAYSINPEATRQYFPMLSALADKQLSSKDKGALDKFGNDMSILMNMNKEDQRTLMDSAYVGIQRSIEMAKIQESGLMSRAQLWSELARKASDSLSYQWSRLTGEAVESIGFSTGFWGQLNNAVFEKSGSLRKAVKFAKKHGAGDMNNSANPYYLVRLMSNYQRNRMKNLVEKGLVDGKGNRVLDDGNLMNFSWLYGTLDATTEARLTKDISMVEDLLVIQGIESRRKKNKEKYFEEQKKELTKKYEKEGLKNGLTLEKAQAEAEARAEVDAKTATEAFNPDVTGVGYGIKNEEQVVQEMNETFQEIKDKQPEKWEAIEEAARRYRAFSLQIVRYGHEAGRFTDERLKEIEENQDDYVAMQAAMDEISTGVTDQFKRSGNIKTIRNFEKRKYGSDVVRDNPYSNLTEVLLNGYYEADRNMATKSYVDMLSKIKDEDGGGMTDVRNAEDRIEGDREIKYYEEGVLKSVWVSRDFGMALEMATNKTSPSVVSDIFGKITKDIMQTMITSTPAFATKNLIRDKFHQTFITRRKFNVMKDLGVGKGIRKDIATQAQLWRLKQIERHGGTLSASDKIKKARLERERADSNLSRMELYGGTMSGWYFKERKNYYGIQKEIIEQEVKSSKSVFGLMKEGEEGRKLAAERTKSLFSKPQRHINPSKYWKRWKGAVSKSEEINRVHEFERFYEEEYKKWNDKFLSEGNSPEVASEMANHEANIRAAFEAKDLMDFTLVGAQMQDLNRIFMFLNPALQGLNRAAKTFSHGGGLKGSAALALRMGFYTAVPTILERVLASYGDDEDELQSMPSYQKDMFWNFKILPNTWYRMPKPFEFGMAASGISRAYDYYVNDDEYAFEDYTGSLLDALVPVDGMGVFDSPIMQLVTNKDRFRNKDIVPYYDEGAPLELRNPKYSSYLGQQVHEFGSWMGSDSDLLDARTFDNFIKKTFSNWGSLALTVGDMAGKDDVEWGMPFSKKDAGVLTSSPSFNSRSQQRINEYVDGKEIAASNKIFKKLNEIKEEYSEAMDSASDRELDSIAERFRKESNKVRKELDEAKERDGNLFRLGGRGTPEEVERKKKDDERKKNRRNKAGGYGNSGGYGGGGYGNSGGY